MDARTRALIEELQQSLQEAAVSIDKLREAAVHDRDKTEVHGKRAELDTAEAEQVEFVNAFLQKNLARVWRERNEAQVKLDARVQRDVWVLKRCWHPTSGVPSYWTGKDPHSNTDDAATANVDCALQLVRERDAQTVQALLGAWDRKGDWRCVTVSHGGGVGTNDEVAAPSNTDTPTRAHAGLDMASGPDVTVGVGFYRFDVKDGLPVKTIKPGISAATFRNAYDSECQLMDTTYGGRAAVPEPHLILKTYSEFRPTIISKSTVKALLPLLIRFMETGRIGAEPS